MFELITQHQYWTAVVIYWIFSAAVSSMPEPVPNGSSGYLWLYRFCHTTAGNITTAFSTRIRGLKTLVLVLMIPYQAHPGEALRQSRIQADEPI